MNDIVSRMGIEIHPAIWPVVGLVAAFVLHGITGWWEKRMARRGLARIGRVTMRALRPLIYPALILLSLRLAIIGTAYEASTAVTNTAFVVWAVLVLVAVIRVINGVVEWYTNEIAHLTESEVDDQSLPFLRRVSTIIAITVAFVIVLDRFDVDVSALVATLGVGTLAIALAAQSALTDTISGFLIMIDRPFRIGDRIEIQEIGTWGDVTDIGLRTTRIRARDNRLLVVPNSVIGKNMVINHSIPSSVFRVETHVGIAYGSDIERAREIMVEAVRKQDWVMKEERIEALFMEFGASSLNFRVRCWIEHYVETRRIIDKLNSCLYHALTEAGIDIPFPTHTVRFAGDVQPFPKADDGTSGD